VITERDVDVLYRRHQRELSSCVLEERYLLVSFCKKRPIHTKRDQKQTERDLNTQKETKKEAHTCGKRHKQTKRDQTRGPYIRRETNTNKQRPKQTKGNRKRGPQIQKEIQTHKKRRE